MSFPSSQVGRVYTGPALANAFDVSRWSGNWQGVHANVTTTGSGGGTQYAGVLVDPQWRAEFPMDDPLFPEVLGLAVNTTIGTMYFKHGASAKADRLTGTTVLTVEKTNDAERGEVPRVVVTGHGGILTPNVVAPVS